MHFTFASSTSFMIYLADVAFQAESRCLKLNHPETVAVLAAALEEARRKTVEEVMAET